MNNLETRTTLILDVVPESINITTLWFRDKKVRTSKPGQYIMVWLPGVDEVPMSVSTINKDGRSSVSIKKVGEATKELTNLKQGDRIGIRGPFGNGYTIKGKNQIVVAGGIGAASLLPLVESMVSKGNKPTCILGAKSANMLIYVDRLRELLGDNLLITTDDGSQGYMGSASEYAAILIEKRSYDQIYTCGPELMMVKIYQVAEKYGIPIEASLERYIKCAVGLCGNCSIGSYRVCKDGPIFDNLMLREIKEEFGKTRMDPTGQSIRVLR